MNLQEKVEKLVRYCGQYQSHGFMMDERNRDDDFNIVLQEEQWIRERIDKLKIILLTGEAGDGKSRILRNIGPLLEEHGFSEPCRDFSALAEEDKVDLIRRLKAVLEGASEERLVILANIGVFTQVMLQFDIRLLDRLTEGRGDVFCYNFENRNLAENKKIFEGIVNTFLDCNMSCPQMGCPCYGNCIYKTNIEKIKSRSGLEGVRTICNAIYLTGGHVTFRELLSLLAYIITFGQDCQERQKYVYGEGSQEEKAYYNVFQYNEDILLKKVSEMDPALKRGESYPADIASKKEYVRYRRSLFFENAEKQYEMLNVDYLVEFHEVLQHMNQYPYHYDTLQEKNVTLQMLKKGINKMSNRGKSDTGLVVTDTPLILGSKIRTEFLVMQDMSMIWHRYDLKIECDNKPSERLWNKFYLSYFVDTQEGRLISLLIDYQQFRYLMMCGQDYFLNRNELAVEEFAVNTFYRNILQSKSQAYDSIVIRFEDKKDTTCDFSLTVHAAKNLFGGEQKQSIRIRKED